MVWVARVTRRACARLQAARRGTRRLAGRAACRVTVCVAEVMQILWRASRRKGSVNEGVDPCSRSRAVSSPWRK
eukprot:139860-Prymnesium_polylepis.2